MITSGWPLTGSWAGDQQGGPEKAAVPSASSLVASRRWSAVRRAVAIARAQQRLAQPVIE